MPEQTTLRCTAWLRITSVLLVTGFLHAIDAQAGYDEAVIAYQRKDYPAALILARQAVENGDARGNLILGVLYQFGLGVTANPSGAIILYERAADAGLVEAGTRLAFMYVTGTGAPRNPEMALKYARKTAATGDAEGMYLVALSIDKGLLSANDGEGKTDQIKYNNLASRSIHDRALDIEARDSLYRSADSGYLPAISLLAQTLAATVGDGNLKRMIELASRVPANYNKVLANYVKVAQRMISLGQTYTSPQMFIDAQSAATAVAMAHGCKGKNFTPEAAMSTTELNAISVIVPVIDPTFLPSAVVGYERSYLVRGKWVEKWHYQTCGTTTAVVIEFSADGFGGATFQLQHSP